MQPGAHGRENTSTSPDKRGTGMTQPGLGQPDVLAGRTNLFKKKQVLDSSLTGWDSLMSEPLGGGDVLGGNSDRRSRFTVAQGTGSTAVIRTGEGWRAKC